MMLASNYKDNDGFKLQFEENCPDNDKQFFVQQYPLVNNVTQKRLHCTTCDTHIGSAPISEKIVRTHQVLNVTQCNKCHAFYVSCKSLKYILSFCLFLYIFRIPVNLEKVKTDRNIIVDGAVKAAKFSAAQHALTFSATNAYVKIYRTRTSRKSRRTTTGRALCATKISLELIALSTGLCVTL